MQRRSYLLRGVARGLVVALALAASIAVVRAVIPSVTDFEAFNLLNDPNPMLPPGAALPVGTVHGQDGWTPANLNGGWTVSDRWGYTMVSSGVASAPLDEGVVPLGDGSKAWRISNGRTFGFAFSSLPFSPILPDELVAGETGAYLYNDFGPDHTQPWGEPANRGRLAQTKDFCASFDFKSETGTPQPGLMIEVDASAKQSATRYSWLRVEDHGAGLDFNTDGGYVATGLSYGEWHHAKLQIKFVDGLNPDGSANDIVTVTVDGIPIMTTTWEDYYAAYEPTRYPHAVDSLMFRVPSGGEIPGLVGHGLLFDNISSPCGNTALAAFTIDEAKVDWKKKADDDKIRVRGSFILAQSSDGIASGEPVIVTIGNFTDTITMDVSDNGKHWDFKRAKGDSGIKDMKLDVKKHEITFEIHVDKADLDAMNLWGDPNQLPVSLQIGDDIGSTTLRMKVHKDKWEYHK